MKKIKLTRDECLTKLHNVLMKAIDVDEDDLDLNVSLFADLNIESTEILEISFRLEQEFDISIGAGEFWNIANLIANEEMFVDRKFSNEAITLIKENLDISEDEILKLESPFELYKFFKIKDLLNFIIKKTNRE